VVVVATMMIKIEEIARMGVESVNCTHYKEVALR
jgi:hypothetical protein